MRNVSAFSRQPQQSASVLFLRVQLQVYVHKACSDSQVIARSRILLKTQTFKCTCNAVDVNKPKHEDCNCAGTGYKAVLEVGLCLLLMCRFHPCH